MNVGRKLEIALQAMRAIAEHDDEAEDVVRAALLKLVNQTTAAHDALPRGRAARAKVRRGSDSRGAQAQ